MIYITGDMHGDQYRFIYSKAEKTWGSDDYIIVCGDFGFLFEDNFSEQFFLDSLETRPYTVCFLSGNHDNPMAISRYPLEYWNGGLAHKIRENIFHLNNGEVYNINGYRFFIMGGAYSLDRNIRIEGKSYWNREMPGECEYLNARLNLSKCNYTVHYILTHTSPSSIIDALGLSLVPEEEPLNHFLDMISDNVTYKHWYCGHFHRDFAVSDSFTVLYRSMQIIK